jgi:hypothetical protein
MRRITPLKQTEISSCQLIAIASLEKAGSYPADWLLVPAHAQNSANKQNTLFRFMAHQEVITLSTERQEEAVPTTYRHTVLRVTTSS